MKKISRDFRVQKAGSMQVGADRVPYILKLSARRRSLGLRIDSAGLTVYAPLRSDPTEIKSLLRQKLGWIQRGLAETRAHQPAEVKWREGLRISYLGRPLSLCLSEGRSGIEVRPRNAQLMLSNEERPSPLHIETQLTAWFKHQAQIEFRERLKIFARRLAIPLPRFHLSNARTRWGSCNWQGEIRLNWRLIMAPIEQVDYVIVHELAHLFEMNHAPQFWNIVERLMPDYREHRDALNARGLHYCSF